MRIGRTIFYDKQTGNIIVNTGEREDYVKPTIEQYMNSYRELKERDPETIGYIELEVDEYQQDFEEGRLVGVDPETEELIFDYSDPADPEAEPILQTPLSTKVTAMGQSLTEIKLTNIQNRTTMNGLGSELAGVKIQGMMQQQTISALGAELAAAKIEIMQLKGGE